MRRVLGLGRGLDPARGRDTSRGFTLYAHSKREAGPLLSVQNVRQIGFRNAKPDGPNRLRDAALPDEFCQHANCSPHENIACQSEKFSLGEYVHQQMIAKFKVMLEKQSMEIDLKSHLKRAGLTQTALADAVGVNKSYISEVLAGKKSPSTTLLVKIAHVLQIDMDLVLQEVLRLQGETLTTVLPSRAIREAAAADFPGRIESDVYQEKKAEPHGGEWDLICSLVVPDKSRVARFFARRDMPTLGILANDAVVIEVGGVPVPGDAVIAAVASDEALIVRMYQPGVLLSHEARAVRPMIRLDHNDATILGPVRAVVRAPLLPK